MPQQAAANPYPAAGLFPNAGSYNPATYSFTATGNSVTAYFLGKTGAVYDDFLEVFDNGNLLTATNGSAEVLENHVTSLGASVTYNTGIKAGDTLTFGIVNATLNASVYSNPALNGAYDASAGSTTGQDHIYSTAYSGSATAGSTFPATTGVAAGTYVGFEDIPIGPTGNSDYSYDDEAFVFTSTNVVTNVPEPGTLSILGFGLAGLGMLYTRRQRAGATA